MQTYAAAVLAKPLYPLLFQAVERGVIDDEKHLAAMVSADEQSQEPPEGVAIKSLCELVGETRVSQMDGAEDVSCLSLTVGVDSGLLSAPSPGLMERAVEPEARLVAK